MTIPELEAKARWARQAVFEMITTANKGHIGGSFSCIDILIALYQGQILQVDPKRPDWEDRDRFIFSKGHSAEALYAVLADFGFFSKDILKTYGQGGSSLGGHVDNKIAGIEVSSGSLGHGLGIAAGWALAAKLDKKSYVTVTLLGDGECYEGSVWEAAQFASHHTLNNVIAIIDRNQQITLDYTENCNRLEPFAQKWQVFGWDVVTIPGHSFQELLTALQKIHRRPSSKPLAVIAETTKGKGVSFMEKEVGWHHNVPKGEKFEQAKKELWGR